MQTTFCPYCLRMVQTDICPYCGNDVNYPGNPMQLPVGYTLNGRHPYILGASIGQGGFGITYIALDAVTGSRVAVKEYFPAHCSGRNNATSVQAYQGQDETYRKGKEHFLIEAQTLQQLAALEGIVNVQDFFEANNTAYLVMEFLEGCSLKNYVTQNGKLPAQQFLQQLLPLMEDIEAMHQQGVIHRDIAPDNIMLQPDGTMKLIDFGSARSYLSDKSMTVVVKKGFAPVEQYMRKGSGTYTDVYALAATIYYCVTGNVPPESAERQYYDVSIPSPQMYGAELTDGQIDALAKALEIQPKVRTQRVAQLIEGLKLKPQIEHREPETIFRAECNIIQENSPVVISSLELVRNYERQAVIATCKFRNLSAKRIRTILIGIQYADSNGQVGKNILQCKVDCEQQGHNALVGNTTMMLIPEKPNTIFGGTTQIVLPEWDTASIAVTVQKVLFADGSERICGSGQEAIPEPAQLETYLGNAPDVLQEYRQQTTENAVVAPALGRYFWRCCCGQINPVAEMACVSCSTPKEPQFRMLDVKLLVLNITRRKEEAERTVREAAERAAQEEKERIAREAAERAAQEEKERIAREAAERAAQEEKERIAREAAERAAQEEKERIAREAAERAAQEEKERIAREAAERAAQEEKECVAREKAEREAKEEAEHKTLEEEWHKQQFDGQNGNQKKTVKKAVIAAAVVTVAVVGTLGIRYGITTSRYNKAEQLMADKNYAEAYSAFKELGDYKDSSVQASAAAYAQGTKQLADGDYLEAASSFQLAGSYLDSSEKSEYCNNKAAYIAAEELFDARNYEDAAAGFAKLGSFEDSQARAKEASYLYADNLMVNAQYQQAWQVYKEISDYKDSKDLADHANYLYAGELAGQGKFHEAYTQYAQNLAYRDSKEQASAAEYTYGCVCMDSKQYAKAIEAFERIGSYKDSQAKLSESRYQSGWQLMEKSAWAEAAELFKALGGYRDSATQYKDARYYYGCELLNGKVFDSAVEVFAELGAYRDCSEKILEAKYQYVINNQSETNEKTFAYLSELKKSDYKDSRSLYDFLFAWTVTLVSVDTEENSNTDTISSVSGGTDYLYLRFNLSGGGPGEKVKLQAKIYFPNGSSSTTMWYDEKSNGSNLGLEWPDGLYRTNQTKTTGTLTVKFYIAGTNEFIGEASVEITS